MPQKQETQECRQSFSNPEHVPSILNAVPGTQSPRQTSFHSSDSPCLPPASASVNHEGPLPTCHWASTGTMNSLRSDRGLSGQWCRDNEAKHERLQASYSLCHHLNPTGRGLQVGHGVEILDCPHRPLPCAPHIPPGTCQEKTQGWEHSQTSRLQHSPRMQKVAAKASTQDSLQGRP